MASLVRFAPLVIAGDPQILCGMKQGQNTAAVARLWHLVSAEKFYHRGQQEPQELCDGQRQRREDRPHTAAPRHGHQCQATGASNNATYTVKIRYFSNSVRVWYAR